MQTHLLSKNRFSVANWLRLNVADSPEIKKRTQTSVVYNNGDAIRWCKTIGRNQVSQVGLTNQDIAIVLTDGCDRTLLQLQQAYQRAERMLTVNRIFNGETELELRRQALIKQMRDLEREEQLHEFARTINIPGMNLNDVKIKRDTATGIVQITLTGKYT